MPDGIEATARDGNVTLTGTVRYGAQRTAAALAVGGLTGDTKTQAEGKVNQATGQLQNTFGSAKDAAREGAATFGSELDSFMSEKPMTSLLIAVGAGYVLARLMHR